MMVAGGGAVIGGPPAWCQTAWGRLGEAQVLLALILTVVVVFQAKTCASVLRSRRMLARQRRPRVTELAWIAIPVVVVLFLAARSWIVAFDLGPPTMASVTPVAVSAQPSAPPIARR